MSRHDKKMFRSIGGAKRARVATIMNGDITRHVFSSSGPLAPWILRSRTHQGLSSTFTCRRCWHSSTMTGLLLFPLYAKRSR